MLNVFVSSFAPFSTISLPLSSESDIGDVYDALHSRIPPSLSISSLILSALNGQSFNERSATLGQLANGGDFVNMRLTPRVLGGKGGFGSQLRAAGGRMSSQKTSNNDSCRDLSGRRLSTVKEAKKYVLLSLLH